MDRNDCFYTYFFLEGYDFTWVPKGSSGARWRWELRQLQYHLSKPKILWEYDGGKKVMEDIEPTDHAWPSRDWNRVPNFYATPLARIIKRYVSEADAHFSRIWQSTRTRVLRTEFGFTPHMHWRGQEVHTDIGSIQTVYSRALVWNMGLHWQFRIDQPCCDRVWCPGFATPYHDPGTAWTPKVALQWQPLPRCRWLDRNSWMVW